MHAGDRGDVKMSLLLCSKVVGQHSAIKCVLRDWRIIALENGGDLTFLDCLKEWKYWFDNFTVPGEFTDSPLIWQCDFQNILLHVKVGQTVPIFVKFTMKLEVGTAIIATAWCFLFRLLIMFQYQQSSRPLHVQGTSYQESTAVANLLS